MRPTAIINKYVEGHRSIKQIAEEEGSNYWAIRKLLLDEGIELRTKGQKFVAVVWEVDDKGCWNCTSHGKTSFGYRQIMTFVNGKRKLERIHRWLYKRRVRDIHSSIHLMHICDNVDCINPDHLREGNQRKNIKDCYNKRRHTFGEKNGMAKLSNEDIPVILSMRGNFTQKDIAKKFGVAASNISNILNKKAWVIVQEERGGYNSSN